VPGNVSSLWALEEAINGNHVPHDELSHLYLSICR
jgi:hypothetical protein